MVMELYDVEVWISVEADSELEAAQIVRDHMKVAVQQHPFSDYKIEDAVLIDTGEEGEGQGST
jgi:hypothetical protein